jgi:hypothetical protein
MKRIFPLIACLFLIVLIISCERTFNDNSSDNKPIIDNDSTIAEADDENMADHDEDDDYILDSTGIVYITLKGTSITVSSTGATVEGSKVTINTSGTYSISGSLSDGQIVVNTKDNATVKMVLNGADISSSTSAPIYIKNAGKTIVILAEGTENRMTDGYTYVYDDVESKEPNAAIFSKCNLTIYGDGSLIVRGNFNDGISGKDGLIISSGTINVNSADDGIRGKDYLIIKDGDITINAGGDGLKSDNEDMAKGYILIETGHFDIASGGDAITAESDALIMDGEFNLLTGGGYNNKISENLSAKAIKGVVNTIIESGTFVINSADDAIHSNRNCVVGGGNFSIQTGDDGMHADSTLVINGGNIVIATAYEGLESANVRITIGKITIRASDDGINGAGGPITMTQFGPAASGDLYIQDGYIYVESGGDGIDINGSVQMSGGTLIVNGPTANDNGAIDYDQAFELTGGYLLAVGSSGMAQAPGTNSTQYSVLVNLNAAQQAGSLVHFQTSDGAEICTFMPVKKYQSVLFSSSVLKKNSTYDVYLGGSSTGSTENGLYQNGNYTPGIKYTSFSISSVVTKIGSSGNINPRP